MEHARDSHPGLSHSTSSSSTSQQQSRSMPSTPFHRPQSRTEGGRSPSPARTVQNASPRSLPNDTSQTPPAPPRKHYGGCRYETGMAKARRRVPYSLGPDPLSKDTSDLKTRLTHDEDQKLTDDLQKLYQQLLPTAESEQRRGQFVQKLDKIIRMRWPNSDIKVNVFGSTGNNLGTSESDVDICITTDCRELERVCSIADLLAKHGMERVVCVSSAKVPIVKVWDPELQVACDINVNNPIALENTELVRSYVALDDRVRPLAMIIKYWAKRRILNDAALGGTLSSYTWICLALNFLQTRDPPILPTLQQQANLEPRILGGINVSFDHHIEAYKDCGRRNTSSLAELLFHFFRYYGHELDFEQHVVSVRLGRTLPKTEKAWHLLQDNRLCVEEPFNISRNLANTADDTSMRGIHLELRRAFGLLAEGKLDQCCEQFEYPPDEPKTSEHFVPPSARPVIPQPPTQPSRGGKNPVRGPKHVNHVNRTGTGRRSSNPAGRSSTYLRNLPFQMTTQELQLQAQHQQHLLHDHLFQQYQYLQLQEQELRMQLHQQNLRQSGLVASGHYPAYTPYAPQDDSFDGGASGHFNGLARAPLSAPLYQNRFPPPSPYPAAALPRQGVTTHPSSPHLGAAVPDTRRYPRRTSVTQPSSGASLRAHSQPARAAGPSTFGPSYLGSEFPAQREDHSTDRRSSASSTSQLSGYMANGVVGASGSLYDAVRRPAEYVGYYVGHSPSLYAYPQTSAISPIPSHAGLAIQHGGLSPRLASSFPGTRSAVYSPPFHAGRNTTPFDVRQPTGEVESHSLETDAATISDAPPTSGPLIVDGSVNSPRRRRPTPSLNHEADEHTNFSASTSDDLAFDTPSSSDEQSQDALEFPTHETSPPCSPHAAGQPPAQGLPCATELVNGHLAPPSAGATDPTDALGNDGSKAANGQALTSATSHRNPALAAWHPGRQLSSVEEVRTPSPSPDQQHPTEGNHVRADAKGPNGEAKQPNEKKFRLANGTALPQEESTEPLTVRRNGAVAAQPADSASCTASNPVSGWQTQKRKKKSKKGVKSENDVYTLNASGGESLPLDESLRKGG